MRRGAASLLEGPVRPWRTALSTEVVLSLAMLIKFQNHS